MPLFAPGKRDQVARVAAFSRDDSPGLSRFLSARRTADRAGRFLIVFFRPSVYKATTRLSGRKFPPGNTKARPSSSLNSQLLFNLFFAG
ncbi:MAG: hypothetical protein MPL62_01400 [Alphaproteobacteria bacterium]|nr:hypothetical protein [Alphaproteobacteria bacterium]